MSMRLLPAVIMSLAVFAPSFAAQAEEFIAQSQLTAATVYSGRATLTRQAVVEIPAGAHTVVFEGLSANLFPDSLRAEGKANGDVKFGAVTHKMVAGAELAAPREKELNAELEKLQDQRAVIEAEKQALSAKQLFLGSIGQQALQRTHENIADFNLKPEEWGAAADVIFAGTGEALKAQLAQDLLLRDLDRQIAKIQTELNQIRTGQSNTYRVALPLEAKEAVRLTVDLSYQMPNATWTPLYDARLDTKTGKLDLVQYGAVRQSTGEDWEGVALTLSTAQPEQGAELPSLYTMWVNLIEYGMPMAEMMGGMANIQTTASRKAQFAAPAAPMEADAASYDELMVKEERAAEFAAAQIETGGFVNEYVIPGPSDVKADGTESKLLIGAFETESKLQVHVKPQLSTKAGLVSRVTLKGEATLLAGRASLFRDGAYIGQTSLPLLRPGEESKLSFGIDDQVSVERFVNKDEKSEAGVIAKDSVLERHFKTKIRNLHTEEINLVVLETVPVPQDEKIRVEVLQDVTTPGYKKDTYDIKGLLSWEKKMEPKTDMDVKLGWKVSWPKDTSLSGL